MAGFIQRWRKRLAWVLGLLIFLFAFGYWQWHRQLNALGINSWSLSVDDWSLTHLDIAQARVVGHQQGRDFDVSIENALINWQWRSWQPRLERIAIDTTRLVLGPSTTSDISATSQQTWQLPDQWRLPEALPQQVQLGHVSLVMPCEHKDCSLTLSLHAFLAPEAARVQLILLDAPEPLRLGLDYRLQQGLPHVDADLVAARFAQLQSRLSLITDEEVGRRWSADMDLEVERPDAEWQAYLLRWHPGLDVRELETMEAALGLNIDQLKLSIKSRLDETQVLSSAAMAAAPLTLHLETRGDLKLQLEAGLQLDTEHLGFALSDARVDLMVERWAPVPDIQLTQLHLQQAFEVRWVGGQLDYHLKAPGELQLEEAKVFDVAVQQLALQLDQLSVVGSLDDWRQMMLDTRGKLQIARLEQAHIHPISLHWQGNVTAAERHWQLKGDLMLNERVSLHHEAQWQEEQLSLDARLGDVFLLAGNSLAQLTPHWPKLLTLTPGRLGARAQLRWQLPELMPEGEARLHLNEVGGIYDTTAFSGATGEVRLQLKGKQLQLASEKLHIKQLVQGFTLGPIDTAGQYRASLDQPARGKLEIRQLQSQIFGGRALVQPASLDFSRLPQQLLVELHEIDLVQVLAEYPSTDITGSGRLSGSLPLTLGTGGVSISQGGLAALVPGGRLQYRSARASAMAASNPGMQLITEALDDFHYSVLASDVTYDESGRLFLGLRLQGNNPAVEGGRQINFTINLEEDLPAMIASLQLSNQVSEQIKKRVQEKLRHKEQK